MSPPWPSIGPTPGRGAGAAPMGLAGRGADPAVPSTYSMSETFASGDGTSPRAAIPLWEKTYSVWVSGSYDPPGQFAPPNAPGETIVASGPPSLLTDGGVNNGPIRYCDTNFSASAWSSGVKLIRLSLETPWLSNAGGLVGNGCFGAYHSPGTSPCGTGRSSMGQMGSPFSRLKTYKNACFVGCATALMILPFTVMSTSIGAQGMSISQRPW